MKHTDSFPLSLLRRANAARMKIFPNAKGVLHNSGEDWSLSDWFTAILGELGEAANVAKKIRRGDFTLDEVHAKLAQEFADVQIYLDMLASAAGIDLAAATIDTWNAKSNALRIPLLLNFDAERGWFLRDFRHH